MTFGRMAVLQDPTGAVFAIWQPTREHRLAGGQRPRGDDDEPGQHHRRRRRRELLLGALRLALRAPDRTRRRGGVQYWGIFNGERLNGGMMELVERASPRPACRRTGSSTSPSADLDACGREDRRDSAAKVRSTPTRSPRGASRSRTTLRGRCSPSSRATSTTRHKPHPLASVGVHSDMRRKEGTIIRLGALVLAASALLVWLALPAMADVPARIGGSLSTPSAARSGSRSGERVGKAGSRSWNSLFDRRRWTALPAPKSRTGRLNRRYA